MSNKEFIDFLGTLLFVFLFVFFIITLTLYLSGSLIYDHKIKTTSDQDLFFDIAKRFADQHTYINGSYNCNNFSKDFSVIANNLGYEVFVYENYQDKHAYNLVAIEPQTGRLKTTS